MQTFSWKNFLRRTAIALGTLCLALLVFIVVTVAYAAWNDPPAPPPSGGTPAPIVADPLNTAPFLYTPAPFQEKSGKLAVHDLWVDGSFRWATEFIQFAAVAPINLKNVSSVNAANPDPVFAAWTPLAIDPAAYPALAPPPGANPQWVTAVMLRVLCRQAVVWLTTDPAVPNPPVSPAPLSATNPPWNYGGVNGSLCAATASGDTDTETMVVPVSQPGPNQPVTLYMRSYQTVPSAPSLAARVDLVGMYYHH